MINQQCFILLVGFQYGVLQVMISVAYSSPEKFQKRAVQFGFPEEVTPVVRFLEASGRRFWKGFTGSNKSPLAIQF